MTRTEARELIMQLLFQMEVQNDYTVELKDRFLNEQKKHNEQKDYIENLFSKLTGNLDSIDLMLENCSDNWKTARMSKVDLAILRLSTAEILYMSDIPNSVSINEAVDMAKKYGTEESSKFINGLLGKVVKINNVQ